MYRLLACMLADNKNETFNLKQQILLYDKGID